jgi:prevent-host-death family protein
MQRTVLGVPCLWSTSGVSLKRPEFATIMAMKQVSIQDLKAGLSAAVAEAESGQTILITRHNEPVAQLGPTRVEGVHRGTRVGRGRIQAALKRGTRGRYLTALLEDRGIR